MSYRSTSRDYKTRVRFIFIGISFLFGLVLVKLFNIQVLNSQYWNKLARAQHTGSYEITSERGRIYSSKKFPLVLNSNAYDLYIVPSESPDAFEPMNSLFNIVYSDVENKSEKRNDWRKKTTQNDKQFAYLEKDISKEKKEKIDELNLNWVGLIPRPERAYPDNKTYSHLLGFVGKNKEGEDKGYFGVEGFYNGDLSGTDGRKTIEKSAGGDPILFGSSKSIEAINGSDLVLTINRTIQHIAYKNLKEYIEKTGAESGNIIVVEPKTGKLLALTNYPSYDPAEYSKYYSEDSDIFVNKAVSSTYEPGSVIKALTVASAVDKGLVSPATVVKDTGPITISGYEIDNWDEKHHGEITVTEVLELSNNIGASKIGRKAGAKNLYNYFNEFGLNSKLGIDLEGEEKGFIRNYQEWSEVDTATASFGQGISATPLQVAMAFSVFANDGVLMKPYIVEEIISKEERVKNEPTEMRRVISKETSDVMVEMLTRAAGHGEAEFFMSNKYYVAGKTGTAQIAEQGEYLKDATNATFVGFLPKYKDFVMLVRLEKPKTSVFASETAVPLWMSAAEEVSNYLGLKPTKNE